MDSPLSATCDATVSCMKMLARQMPTVHFAAFCLHVVALERIEKMKTVKTKERLVLTREIVEREKPNDFFCIV